MRSSTQIMFAAIIAVALIGLFSATAFAAPPANDNLANAQLISGFSGTTAGMSNVEASKETGEPAHAWNRGGRSVWFKYIAPGNGVLILDTLSSNFDTLLAVYQGSSMSDLKLIAANDNLQQGGFASASRLTIGTQNGATYYIAVDAARNQAGEVFPGAVVLKYELTNTMLNNDFSTIGGYGQLDNIGYGEFVTLTNVGASKEPGEPNHAGNGGGRSVWYRLNSNSTHRSYTFKLEGKSLANPAVGINTLMAIYKGTTLANLTPVTSRIVPAGQVGTLTVNMNAGETMYLAIDGVDEGAGAAAGNFTLFYSATKSRKQPDLDRDGRTDISVYRPTTGQWFSRDSVTGELRATSWGVNGDKPLFNHWDDDNKPDLAVFRPESQIWHLLRSNNSYEPFSWGINTDIPLTVNQFTQGRYYCYAAVFRPLTGTWWIRGNGVTFSFQFGQNGDLPMAIDVNGDGTDEAVVFRPANSTWYVGDPFTGAFVSYQQFGLNGDRPVPADYDGDGKTDLAVFRPLTTAWYILRSEDGTMQTIVFGNPTDKPQPADFDGDGSDDVAVFRPATGTWYIRRSSYNDVQGIQFGISSDIPLSSPLY